MALPPVEVQALGDGPLITALIEAGVAAWIGPTDMSTVRLAVRLADDIEQMRTVLDDGFDKDVFAAYIATVKEYRACLSLLGLSPSDRSRLGVAEVKARSKLEEMLDRRKAGRHAS